MIRFGVLSLSLAVVATTGVPARAHDFHSSFSVVERSADASVFEISIRVFADDLESALSARTRTPVRIDVTSDLDRLIHDYVSTSFEIVAADGRPKPLTWVGKEARVDSMWVYVEAPAEPLAGLRLRNRVLQEQFGDQVNLVQVKDGRLQRMLNFRRGDGFKPLVD